MTTGTVARGGAEEAEPILQLANISKSFPGVQALDDVSFDVRRGEVHGLVGENGAGKSTLVKILAGGLRRNAGSIWIAGEEVPDLDPERARRLGISVSYQEINLVPQASVAENVLFGALPTRFGLVNRSALRAAARSALEQVGAEIDPDEPVGGLSVARRQLVEIARAVHLASLVIILDEPTAALSQHEAETLHDVIDRLRRRDVAVIYISHRLEEVLRISDRITVLRDGRHVATLPSEATGRSELVRLMIGRSVIDMYPERRGRAGDTLLETRGLRRLGSPHSVDLRVGEGEIVGVFGLVGSGRSEAVRLMAGIDPAGGGTISIDGQAVALRSPAEALRHGIAFLPEDRKMEGLVLDFSLRENLILPNLRLIARARTLTRRRELDFTRDRMRSVSIRAASPEQPAGTLSGGNQQRVVIGKWLGRRPRVLIVDEPTRGIDIGAKAQVHEILVRLADDGIGILMVSSELPEVLGLSDRVLVFHDGRVAGEMSRDEATPESVMELAIGPVGATR